MCVLLNEMCSLLLLAVTCVCVYVVQVFNKVDRDTARLGEVENEVFDLFVALDATDEQLDFPMVYASAKEVRVVCGAHAPSGTSLVAESVCLVV